MTINRRDAIISGLLATGLTGCGRNNAIKLRSADAHPDGYPTVEAVKYMGRLLGERSGGRLQLKMFSGGQLGAEKDTLEIAIFGGIDFNRVNLAPLNSICEETIVPALPFMFRSINHMRRAMDGAPGDAILSALEPHGLIGLCYYDSGARSFYTRERAIMEPSDLKGLKIRVQNSDLYVSLIETLGGDATPMNFGEVYQGILQGVIDGAENNFPSYQSTRHFEVARHYSLSGHVMAPEALVMSSKKWQRLSESDQVLIRECARESVQIMRDLWDERVKKSKEIILEAGVKIYTPLTEPFVEKVQPVWAEYLVGKSLKKIAEDIQNMEG